MRPNEVSYKVTSALRWLFIVRWVPGCSKVRTRKRSANEFTQIRLMFRRQVQLPVEYRCAKILPAYRIDFVVEDCVVVEAKRR